MMVHFEAPLSTPGPGFDYNEVGHQSILLLLPH